MAPRLASHLLLGLALLLVPLAATAAEGAPVLDRIVKSGTLRVGVSGNQAPLNMKNKAGEVIGLEAELAMLLADSMKVRPTFVVKPFGELLGALEKGEVDIVMSGVTITPERNLKAAFVGPYFVSGKSVLAKSSAVANLDAATKINSPDTSLAALENSTSARFVQLVTPQAKLVTVKDYDEGVQMVIDGKVNALIADYPICVLSVLRFPEAELATLLQPLTIEPIGIALPPNDPLFMNLVENYLAALRDTGLLEQLKNRWLEDGSWLKELP